MTDAEKVWQLEHLCREANKKWAEAKSDVEEIWALKNFLIESSKVHMVKSKKGDQKNGKVL